MMGCQHDNKEILAKVVSKVPDSQVLSDLDAAVAWAGKNGGDVKRLGITGFCRGGRITWLYAAHNPNVRAGVAWYGRLVGGKTDMNPLHRSMSWTGSTRPCWASTAPPMPAFRTIPSSA